MSDIDTASAEQEPLRRVAARVLLLDEAGRVLMFEGHDPANPADRYWFTVGGGLEPGETAAEGAAREMFEETGVRVPVAALGEPVAHEVTVFPFDGRRYRQEQDYFVYRAANVVVRTDGFGADERRSIIRHRWWSVAELEATTERFYPTHLPALVRAGLAAAATAHGGH